MKNKMQKLLMMMLVGILFTSNSFADETYARRDALIGGTILGVTGGVLGYFVTDGIQCLGGENCHTSTSTDVIGGAVAGVVGAGIGAGIGYLVGRHHHKHSDVSIASLLMQSKTQGNTTGGSVEVTF